jgi:hypothetical protein
MNLLEKYKAMATTGERKKVKKGFLGELPAISAQSPPVGSNRVAAPAMTVIWENPHPKGTKAARDFSRKAIEEARGVN